MVKTQIQLPDELYRELKRVAAAKEWSLAETLRRGAEWVVATHPGAFHPSPTPWQLPAPIDLGLIADPFADPDWREDANLSAASASLIAEQLRARATRLET
ncbi:MAG: antitoxin [Verrucomicrobia bacterium]|nr:antitoxin [Verrucomicrobiota bacterium]